jgi:Fe2+ transport system protein FeoA
MIEVEDGFAHEDGRPNDEMPSMRMVFTFEQTPTGSRFTGVTRFPSLEAMERLVEMGMVEGMRSASGEAGRGAGRPHVVRGGWCHRSADPQRHAGTHQPSHPRDGRAGVARTPRRRRS